MFVVKEGFLSFLGTVIEPARCFNFHSVNRHSHVIVFNSSTIINNDTPRKKHYIHMGMQTDITITLH